MGANLNLQENIASRGKEDPGLQEKQEALGEL